MGDSIVFELDDNVVDQFAKIKVIGVGGGGSNAVNRMISPALRITTWQPLNRPRYSTVSQLCREHLETVVMAK